MTIESLLTVGFLLGMRHALDADHVAAVATLATRSESVGHTVGLGFAWGMGHTLTLMLFGGAVLLLGLVVPLKAAEVLELAVGVMLVLLGASVVYRSWRDGFHWHGHARAPAGGAGSQESALHDRGHRHEFAVRALVVGMVHGMAGSAALILLSLEAADSLAWGVGYIAVFGLGSILGMGFLSVAIAIPLRLTSRYLARAYGALTAAVGLATLALGCMLILEFATGVGAANHR